MTQVTLFQVGAALSMTYVTGQPIIFVGCGQASSSKRPARICSFFDIDYF